MKQLILGGARSGKSRLAEARALEWSDECPDTCSEIGRGELIYVATAKAGDDEMRQRIRAHQAGRDARWQLVEAPLKLAEVLDRLRDRSACVLVDCLTLWISNALHEKCWPQERDQLLEVMRSLQDAPLSVVLVSNEVGSGVVPMGQLSREFVDASGWLHQALVPLCDTVTLVVAGLPLTLKGES